MARLSRTLRITTEDGKTVAIDVTEEELNQVREAVCPPPTAQTPMVTPFRLGADTPQPCTRVTSWVRKVPGPTLREWLVYDSQRDRYQWRGKRGHSAGVLWITWDEVRELGTHGSWWLPVTTESDWKPWP